MKKILFVLLWLPLTFDAYSQDLEQYVAKPVEVTEIVKMISQGEVPGYKVDVYDVEKDDILKDWEKLISSGSRSKAEEMDNEVIIKDAVIEDISLSPINIYSVLNEYADRIELNVFIQHNAEWLTKRSDETAYLGAKKVLREFAMEAYKENVEDVLNESEKELKDLEGDLKKLINSLNKEHENIGKEERDIENNKDAIATNEMDEERLRKQIEQQKDAVSRLKRAGSEEALKEAEKILKDLNSDLGKEIKDSEGLYKSIGKSEGEIREIEREIAELEGEIALKEIEIKDHKTHVFRLEKKLELIE